MATRKMETRKMKEMGKRDESHELVLAGKG
jgi:hypothetical protein